MKKTRALILKYLCMVVFAVAPSAFANTITYNFWLDATNGYPITDLVLYAADSNQDSVFLSPIELAPSGNFQLSQSVDFTPTSALILGITERDKDDWWDIVMFVNDAFAESILGVRYDSVFLDTTPYNLRHNELSVAMQDAHNGDLGAFDSLANFLRNDDAAAAYFDPTGSFSIIQFTAGGPPMGGDIPEPATVALVGLGLAGFGWSRRKKV